MGQWSLWVLGVFLILCIAMFRIFKKPGTKATAVLGLLFIFIIGFNYLWNDAFSFTSINSQIAELTGGDYKKISLEFILGYTFAPLMWLLGVAHEDMALVGRLLGEKIIASEFIGYISLSELKNSGAFEHYKSIIMATYMLAGFANFASIGIQIGGIGSLAPGRKTLLSQYGIKALIGGTLASLMSATIVGMILG
jgi:CNT family concentrative nucleoside transporter